VIRIVPETKSELFPRWEINKKVKIKCECHLPIDDNNISGEKREKNLKGYPTAIVFWGHIRAIIR